MEKGARSKTQPTHQNTIHSVGGAWGESSLRPSAGSSPPRQLNPRTTHHVLFIIRAMTPQLSNHDAGRCWHHQPTPPPLCTSSDAQTPSVAPATLNSTEERAGGKKKRTGLSTCISNDLEPQWHDHTAIQLVIKILKSTINKLYKTRTAAIRLQSLDLATAVLKSE